MRDLSAEAGINPLTVAEGVSISSGGLSKRGEATGRSWRGKAHMLSAAATAARNSSRALRQLVTRGLAPWPLRRANSSSWSPRLSTTSNHLKTMNDDAWQ